MSIRAFSKYIGESTGTTNNYIGSRLLAPKHKYIAKVRTQFSYVDAYWLLTGIGEPVKEGTAPNQNQANSAGKQNAVNVAGGSHGTATSHTTNNYILHDCEKERDSLRAERDSLVKQVELPNGQLQMQETIIEGKRPDAGLAAGWVQPAELIWALLRVFLFSSATC